MRMLGIVAAILAQQGICRWPLSGYSGFLCAESDLFVVRRLELEMPEPYCLAMVLCDAVHRDTTTGKYTILGTFSTLGARKFPAQLQFCVYYSITDGLGPTTLRLRLVDARCGIANGVDDAESVVFEASADFDFENPLLVLEAVMAVKTPIPNEGLYHCELWAGDELLMSRRLLAALTPVQQQGDKGEDDE
jgi:hypothetical protein